MLSKIRKKKLEANIWKFYLYRIFASLIFITPIYVLFYQSNGLNMTQVMILQSAYTAIIMLTVVPAGIIADYLGRKKLLIANAFMFALSWIIYAISYNFWSLLIAEAAMALSAAMWMASGTAFFYDTLKELGKEKNFKKLFGSVIGINYVTWGLSSLAGGYIAAYGLRLPFWITAIPSALAFLITFSFTDTLKYKHGEKHYLTHLKDAYDFAAKYPKIKLFIIYSAIVMTIGFITYMLYQPYFAAIKIPLVYFGWVYFAISMLAAFGSRYAYRIEEFLGEKKILALLLVVMIVCFFGISKEIAFLGIIFPIILSFTSGIFEPVLSDYINKNTESYHRATVLSLNTLVSEFVTTISAPFFGWMVDFWSLKAAFLAAALILVINLVILIGIFMVAKRRER
jgi:MFS family permease